MKKYVLCLFALIAGFAFAEDPAPPQCDPTGLCMILRPVHDNAGKPNSIPYHFRYRAAQNGAPTVVYIPGGPGATSTEYADRDLGHLPPEFGMILTDPRFTGTNQIAIRSEFTNAIHSLAVAEDILAALRSLGVRDYILWGTSYGTIPATIAASIAKDFQPRAVILDGTVGRAMKFSEYHASFQKIWKHYKSQIDPETLRLFENRVQDFIERKLFTAAQFGSLLQLLILTPTNREDGSNQLFSIINGIAHGDEKELLSPLQEAVKDTSLSDFESERHDSFHEIITCNEVSADDDFDSLYDGKNFFFKANGTCKGFDHRTPYDSKNYQIQSPIYYTQGELDPATPKTQTLYHFDHQTSAAAKFIIEVPNGEHSPLDADLKACDPAFWQSLARDPKAGAQALQPCLEARRFR